MFNQKNTMWLAGLVCISIVSGFFTVTCYGFDGSLAIETVAHNHCECTENGQNSVEIPVFEETDEHKHCNDTLATDSVLFSGQKNTKLPIFEILTGKLAHRFPLNSNSLFFTCYIQITKLPTFHTPLESVIILA